MQCFIIIIILEQGDSWNKVARTEVKKALKTTPLPEEKKKKKFNKKEENLIKAVIFSVST